MYLVDFHTLVLHHYVNSVRQKETFFNLWVLNTGGVREFLSLSICSYFFPLCFWKQPWVPVPAECCNGAPAPGHYSLMAAVHIRGKEVAGMASRINCKLKNFNFPPPPLKGQIEVCRFLVAVGVCSELHWKTCKVAVSYAWEDWYFFTLDLKLCLQNQHASDLQKIPTVAKAK